MKYILSFTLLALALTLAECRPYRVPPIYKIDNEEEFWRYRDNTHLIYQIADSTFSWYPIMFLKFDSVTFVRDNMNHVYLLTDSIGNDYTSLSKLLTRPDVYFIQNDLLSLCIITYVDLFNEGMEAEEMIPPGYITKQFRNITNLRPLSRDKKLNIITFSQPQPSGYLLMLMTGKAYNYITFLLLMDGPYTGPVPFPDENAYYKVLIPLWERDSL